MTPLVISVLVVLRMSAAYSVSMVAHTGRPKVNTTAVHEGHPSQKIERFAEKNEVDLIVMGTHGGAVGRVFLGSVTENVIRASDIPVLVIRK